MNGKTVVLGVSGGIAVYKSCDIVSKLKKLGYNVVVVMTKNATKFVSPLTFETLSQNRVVVDMFDTNRPFEVEHISLAKLADVFLIAPATANVMAKFANGIADDMLSTTILASKAIKIVCPSMNTNMYEDIATTEVLDTLKSRGYHVLEPDTGRLACGDNGKGKLRDVAEIVDYVDKILTPCPDYRGKKLLITAGGTSEPIDGVRYITNKSSGKMGIAIANAALERGAEVTLVVGNIKVEPPKAAKIIKVDTTIEMKDAVMSNLSECDIIIKSAAPADYRVENFTNSKKKGENLVLNLVKNPDIAKLVGENKNDKKLIIFCAETEDLIKNAVHKLNAKNADFIVANDVTKEGAGFDVDTNIVTFLSKSGLKKELTILPKNQIAHLLLDEIKNL